MIKVMTTQSWEWFYMQLDPPIHTRVLKRIKAHVIKNNGKSYCGLKNHDDVEIVDAKVFFEWDDFACSKCRKSLEKREGK